MICHFPKPYPDEWWYSVLARFMQQSGCSHYYPFHRYFFGNINVGCAAAFPVTSFKIIDQLPEGLLNKRELLLKHTVAPFYTRLYTKTEREAFNAGFMSCCLVTKARYMSLDPFRRIGCKYCPVCCSEDKKFYGEVYWHREHQVPLLTVCPTHKCRLHIKEKPIVWWSKTLTSLSKIEINSNVDYDIFPWECEVAKCIMEYLTLPDAICQLPQSRSLYGWLLCKGYEVYLEYGKKTPGRNLYIALKEKYGEDVFRVYFCRSWKELVGRMSVWSLSSPDRYILVQCLLNLSTEEMLSPEPHE